MPGLPNHCASCEARLTCEERVFYGASCERCEQAAFDAFNELRREREEPPDPPPIGGQA